jgi:hypothetical protein
MRRSIDLGELYCYSTVYDRFVIYMRRSIDLGELYCYSTVYDRFVIYMRRSIDLGELYCYSTVYDRIVIYIRQSIDHEVLYSYSSVLYYMIGLSFSCERSMISWFSACISYRMSTKIFLQAWYFPIEKFNVQISSSV